MFGMLICNKNIGEVGKYMHQFLKQPNNLLVQNWENIFQYFMYQKSISRCLEWRKNIKPIFQSHPAIYFYRNISGV